MKKLFTIFSLCAVLISYAQLNNGLVGKFYFNNGTKTNEVDADHSMYDDIQGLSNPTLTADRFGNANKAYYYNGNAAMYYYNTSSETDRYNLNNMNAMSISVWVKPDAITQNISRTVICRWNGLPTGEQFLVELSGSNTLVAIGGGVNNDGDYDTTTYAAATWYHIVFTYNKNDNNRHKIYVNGALKYNKTFNTAYSNTGGIAALLVGMRTNGFNGFLGVIDDISIYDRALTDADVACLYNEPDPTSLPVSLGVNLNASPLSVCAGNQVSLTATPSGAVANYSWNAGITSNTATAVATPTSTTTYTVNVTDASGCYGASASLEVTVNDLPIPNVIHLGNTLSTQPAFSSYQWMLNGNDIAGATSQTYIATQNGTYSVRVTDANGCSNTSNAVNVTASGLSEIEDFRSVIYPNPTSSVLYVASDEEIASIQVADLTGRILITENNLSTRNLQFSTSALVEATYLIHIKTTTGKTAVKSFVKQ